MSDIRVWSPIAGNNTDPSPDGYPEGMAPSGVNNSDRETMAAIRRQWEQAEWFDYGHEITYVSATSFTTPGDQTALYEEGRRIRADHPVAPTVYGRVVSSAFAANTTVVVAWDSGQLELETGIQMALGITTAGATSGFPDYQLQQNLGLQDPDILCYQNKSAVDITGGVISGGQVNKEVALESLPNVQGQVANPSTEELNQLVGVDTGQTIQAQIDAINAALAGLNPIGTMLIWPSTNATSLAGTWLRCDGTLVSQATYATLFALIGFSFSPTPGDNPGGGNFYLPDLRGRVPAGFDTGGTGRLTGYRQGLNANQMGNNGGEESHTQTVGELAPHTHRSPYTDNGDQGFGSGAARSFDFVRNTSETGDGEAFNVVQPTLITNFIIRVL